MRILLAGKNGQVGFELAKSLAPLGELRATGRGQLDLLEKLSIESEIRNFKPDIIVNAAAYTAVDRAEDERELAMRVNGEAPGVLAEEAKRLGALLVHYSTDYVFDGRKTDPYAEEDAPNPLNVYGKTKLEGELAIAASGCRHLILRTSWVYSGRGRNFPLAILAAAREGRELRVVDDQFGAPTSAAEIARATARVLKSGGSEGLYHLSAAGKTSWHGFAAEILSQAGIKREIVAVSAREYEAKAKRPGNSLLDNGRFRAAFGFALGDWRKPIREVL